MYKFIGIISLIFLCQAQFSQFIKIPASEIRSIDNLTVENGNLMLNVFHIISLKEQTDGSIKLNLRNDKQTSILIMQNVNFLDFFEKLKLFRTSFVLFEEMDQSKSIILNVYSIASIHESKSNGSIMYLTDGQTLKINKKQRETFYKFMGMNIPDLVD